ncbi:Alpha/Beta hydrolase protein [Rhypophila sp. PSN 637]
MAMHKLYAVKPSPPLSLWERLRLYGRLLTIFPVLCFFNVIRCCIIAAERKIRVRFYIVCGITRVILETLTPREIWHLAPGTREIYTQWITKRHNRAVQDKDLYLADWLQSEVEELPDRESAILWLGDRRKAKKIVYFLHGGGYFVPINNGHLEWCVRAYVNAGKELGQDVAIAVLQYTLSPRGGYPLQLFQAASGLAHILRSGVRPSDMIFGGDSAGGNLTAQLMLHIVHPHPGAEPINLEEPFAGVFAVSPWVSNNMDTASFRENQNIDMLSSKTVEYTAMRQITPFKGYTPDMSKEMGWALANDYDDKTWFEGLEKVTKAIYVTVGGQEILRDQGIEFAERIRESNPGLDVRLEVTKHEAHDWIMVEGLARLDGDATRRMRAWTKGALWEKNLESAK